MKKLIAFGAVAAFALGACDSRDMSAERYSGAAADVAAEMVQAAPPMATSKQSRDQSGETQSEFSSYLAYRYGYAFRMPAANVAATLDAHVQSCLQAGAAKCQILRSSSNSHDDVHVSAQLQLRAEPNWLESFKQELVSSVEAADGTVINSSVSAEDLTRSILDTDARLRSKMKLRERLESHLETRNAELTDLLALERELARVQGEIESATATLAALKKRVSMSIVDINYQSEAVAVSRNAVSPIGLALKDFVKDISYGLANVIRFFAAILPWLIFVIIPIIWLVRRFWRGRTKRVKAVSKTKADT